MKLIKTIENLRSIKYRKLPFNIFVYSLCALCIVFFYKQSTKSGSDLSEHIKFTLEENNKNAYSLFHHFVMLFNDCSAFFSVNNFLFNSCIFIIVLVISVFFSFKLLNDYLKEKYKNTNFYFLDFATIFLLMVAAFLI